MNGTLKKPISKDDHFQGNLKASVQIVEYGDFQCPYCAAAVPILARVMKNYSDSVCLVFRHSPMKDMHPESEKAAVASEAASLQGKFWEMHRELFINQDNLTNENILEIVKDLKLDLNQFQNDIKREDLLQKVKEDFTTGIRSGVNGTPTLFINGIRFEGLPTYEALQSFIEEMLGEDNTIVF